VDYSVSSHGVVKSATSDSIRTIGFETSISTDQLLNSSPLPAGFIFTAFDVADDEKYIVPVDLIGARLPAGYSRLIRSRPPIYGLKTGGISTEPSGC